MQPLNANHLSDGRFVGLLNEVEQEEFLEIPLGRGLNVVIDQLQMNRVFLLDLQKEVSEQLVQVHLQQMRYALRLHQEGFL